MVYLKKKYYLKKKIGTFLKPKMTFLKSNKYIQCIIQDDTHNQILYCKKNFKIKYNFFNNLTKFEIFSQYIVNQLKKKKKLVILLDTGLLKFSKKLNDLLYFLKKEKIYIQ